MRKLIVVGGLAALGYLIYREQPAIRRELKILKM